MDRHYWLVKEEPESLSWDAFVRDGGAAWTGVRNYQARNHLRNMTAGDRVFYYHSGKSREIVGIAEVSRGAYPDPTAGPGGDWSAVDLVPVEALPARVTLAAVRSEPALRGLPLLRQPRLSVVPLTEEEWRHILAMGGAPGGPES